MSKNKKQIRYDFRNSCFERDNYRCVVCKKITSEIDCHHITDRNEMPNGGFVEENGITLCSECHMKAEKYHITSGKEWVDGFHPLDLYKLIKSNLDLARQKSKML